jgi:hypothetical protein
MSCVLQRMINQAKMKSYRREPFCKCGVLVPRTPAQVVEIDLKNNTTAWKDAEVTEMRQLLEYNIFSDQGKESTAPTGYKRIPCHVIYDVNDIKLDLWLLVISQTLTQKVFTLELFRFVEFDW